jgi:hypothetical protein
MQLTVCLWPTPHCQKYNEGTFTRVITWDTDAQDLSFWKMAGGEAELANVYH